MAEFTGDKIESVRTWINNLNKSKTPCMLCKHKSTGDLLLSMSCEAFKDSINIKGKVE